MHKNRPDFDFDSFASGRKQVCRLPVPCQALDDLIEMTSIICGDPSCRASIADQIGRAICDGVMSIPVLVARGTRPGKTLVATAGVHGDEYEGMEAIHRTFDALDPETMTGTFVAVPVVTLPAHWTATRLNPLDGANMARVFPGSPDGSPSQQLAACLLQRVLRHADLYIDLHSAGRKSHWVTLCGYVDDGPKAGTARAAARCFGAPYIWEHPHDPEATGRTLSATGALGIPSLYTEARGGGHAAPQDVDCYTRGLANLLQFLQIAEPEAAGLPTPYEPVMLRGKGDTDLGAIRSTAAGLCWPAVQPGDRVKAGQQLAFIRDLEGTIVQQISSPTDAFVIGIRATPRIFAGESVAMLTQPA